MKNFLLSTAYIYPVCPLSFNHARMFVVTDLYGRYERLRGKNVYFPIATHYSGNTAQKVADHFKQLLATDYYDQNDSTLHLYRDVYGLDSGTIQTFTDAMTILNYYNNETLWELHELAVDADYSHQYTTEDPDFSAFVRAIIAQYEHRGVLVHNSKGALSLKYEDTHWRNLAGRLIEATAFIHPNQRNTVLSALKNIRSDWNLLRDNGYGATYNNQIVDPMFDSEVFSIFDVYVKFRDDHPDDTVDVYSFFLGLFDRLSADALPQNELEARILAWLPCQHFVAEEHLRNWLAKKMHAESLLLNEKYQTPKYTILGMGLLNGRRMSASRGTAILSKDLIEKYGGVKARLLMLMQGGHLSKDFTYDSALEARIGKILRRFYAHLTKLDSLADQASREMPDNIATIEREVVRDIESGYPRNALIRLLENCPKTFFDFTPNEAYWLTILYGRYLENILVPSLMTARKV